MFNFNIFNIKDSIFYMKKKLSQYEEKESMKDFGKIEFINNDGKNEPFNVYNTEDLYKYIKDIQIICSNEMINCEDLIMKSMEDKKSLYEISKEN